MKKENFPSAPIIPKKNVEKSLSKKGPSKWHCIDLVDRMKAGEPDSSIYSSWGIGKTTFYRWLRESENLNTAHEIGLAKLDTKIHKTMEDMMEGNLEGKHSYKAAEWIARNKLGYEPTNPAITSSNSTINIQNMNVLQQIQNDPEKIKLYIEQESLKLKQLGVIDAEFKIKEPDESSGQASSDS